MKTEFIEWSKITQNQQGNIFPENKINEMVKKLEIILPDKLNEIDNTKQYKSIFNTTDIVYLNEIKDRMSKKKNGDLYSWDWNEHGHGGCSASLQRYIKFLNEKKLAKKEKTKNNEINIKNIMLYGAPGVGKTYNYKKLVALIEGQNFKESDVFDFIINNKDEEIEENSIEELYQIVKNENRVEFVTFHQSYSYEDFIEGFRPKENGNIELESGILKSLIDQMNESENIEQIEEGLQNKLSNISEKPTIWKMSLGEAESIKKVCFTNNNIRLGWDNYGDLSLKEAEIKQRELRDFFQLETGDIIFAFKNQWEIDGIGIVTGEYKFNDSHGEYKHERTVDWIIKDKIINIKEYNHNTRMTLSSLYRLWRITKNDVLEIIRKNTTTTKISKHKKKNHYIVIDEINRGNISKIFGELITLIEEEKRGKKEYEVTLPYSKKPFLIPKNLYIIATMNSTDKSIATIDIALRRRFTFLKMTPNLELVKETSCNEAVELMDKLNKYIKDSSLGEDYQLGHSYFMNIENKDDLNFVVEYKIKPLLEEYFYSDNDTPEQIIEEALK